MRCAAIDELSAAEVEKCLKCVTLGVAGTRIAGIKAPFVQKNTSWLSLFGNNAVQVVCLICCLASAVILLVVLLLIDSVQQINLQKAWKRIREAKNECERLKSRIQILETDSREKKIDSELR